MDESLLEIREYSGPGYQPVIDFGTWRVAVLNYLDELHPEQISYMERHNDTDEVFILMAGEAVLLIGEGDDRVEKIHSQVLQTGKIYNVKKSVWHSVLISKDGSILIVENNNTNKENSNYFSLNENQRKLFITTAREEISDWS
jgi:ureidoglycolate hydrolase